MNDILPRGALAGLRLADLLRGATGWKRLLTAAAAGLCGALAMAPVYALPLLAVAFSVLVLLVDGAAASDRPLRRGFAVGWFWGFGYFLAGVYWMAFSFFVQADQFAWMAPFAVMMMPAGLALFTGAACAVAAGFRRTGWERVFLFAAIFSAFEYLRGHILTGLPWNLAGQAFSGTAVSAQTAAWWGAYGLSLVAIFLASAPAAGLTRGAGTLRLYGGLIVALAGLVALYTVGAVRLATGEGAPDGDGWVRIVQPNINQRDKIDPRKWGENFYRQLDLSKGAAPGPAPLYIIWPENGAPLLAEADSALNVLANELPDEAVLISGAVRRAPRDDGSYDYFNAVAVVEATRAGRDVVAFYDKHHLVPFGEYLPFYGFLNAIGLAQLTPYGDAGFAAGEGPAVLAAGGTSFAPLICYEAIFPGAVYPRHDRPRWLVTVTNDAWFGDTSGPRQHLDQARLRSIESGLPMARSANTGISALIDSKGRILDRIPLYRAGAIEAPLPAPLPRPLYDRIGDWGYAAMASALLLFGFRARVFGRAVNQILQPLRDKSKES